MSGPALAVRLRALGAASVLDAAPGGAALGASIRALWAPTAAAGPAFTIETEPDDNLALHRAVAEAPAGAVVVAATGGGTCAIFGDLLSQVALARGLAALVTDGLVRDSDRIRAVGFPVFCTGLSLASPAKRAWGRVGVEVQVGDAAIAAGDWIVADGDGAVVVPAAAAGATADAAEAVRAREAELVARAAAGEATVDQLGLRPGAS
ncbi:MAG TPA: RraA family protein [Gaiellaceae bacterium]|jgi:4-hydroxy-4-methyl-2-oxoglutarate aldolase